MVPKCLLFREHKLECVLSIIMSFCSLLIFCVSSSTVFVIKKDDRGKFFDALTALSAF